MAVTWDDRSVTSIADPGRDEPAEILFGNGNRALLVNDPGLDPGELLSRSGLQPGLSGSRAILVCGGADNLNGTSLTQAQVVLGDAVSAAAQLAGALVFDGGTSSGVMAITGAARARHRWTMPVLVGVAPAGLVSYPGCRPDGERVPLEENHSHFVLARSSEWGGETNLLIGLTAAYAAQGRTVVVLAGGGPVSKSEILESVRRGWPIFVIKGTAGIADAILELWQAYRIPHRRAAAWLWPRKFRYRRPRPLSSIRTRASGDCERGRHPAGRQPGTGTAGAPDRVGVARRGCAEGRLAAVRDLQLPGHPPADRLHQVSGRHLAPRRPINPARPHPGAHANHGVALGGGRHPHPCCRACRGSRQARGRPAVGDAARRGGSDQERGLPVPRPVGLRWSGVRRRARQAPAGPGRSP